MYPWRGCHLLLASVPAGEAFLRQLLSMPIEEAQYAQGKLRDTMYNNFASLHVDPRQLAQRIMEIRTQLAKEFTQGRDACRFYLRESCNY